MGTTVSHDADVGRVDVGEAVDEGDAVDEGEVFVDGAEGESEVGTGAVAGRVDSAVVVRAGVGVADDDAST